VRKIANLKIATRNIGVETSEVAAVFDVLSLTSAAGTQNCCE
jgi:hypothetical protein